MKFRQSYFHICSALEFLYPKPFLKNILEDVLPAKKKKKKKGCETEKELEPRKQWNSCRTAIKEIPG